MYNYIIFFFLFNLSNYLHIKNTKCKTSDYRVWTLNYFHHIISVYGIFGSILFGNHLLHFLALIFVLILWKFYDNRCPLTLWFNEDCNIDEGEQFYDLLQPITRLLNYDLRYMVIFLLLIYDLYFIIKSKY